MQWQSLVSFAMNLIDWKTRREVRNGYCYYGNGNESRNTNDIIRLFFDSQQSESRK